MDVSIDPGTRVCVKHLFEETTNVTRYSWFERSNLVPYEPGMRRRVTDRRPQRESPKGGISDSCYHEHCDSGLSHSNGMVSNLGRSTSGNTAQGWRTRNQGRKADENYDPLEIPGYATHSTVFVEYRWSFLFPSQSPPAAGADPPEQPHWFHKDDNGKPSGSASDADEAAKSDETDSLHESSNEEITADMADTNGNVSSVKEAFSLPEFGGRTSILRCLITNLDTRYLSRPQMSRSFHLSAVSERITQEGVFYLANLSPRWNPVVSREPVDMQCSRKLHRLLRDVVSECRLDDMQSSDYGESRKHRISGNGSGTPKNYQNDANKEQEDRNHVSDPRKGSSPGGASYPVLDLGYLSKGISALSQINHKLVKSILVALSKHTADLPETTEKANSGSAMRQKPYKRIVAILKRIAGERCHENLVVAVLMSVIRNYKSTSGVPDVKHHRDAFPHIVKLEHVKESIHAFEKNRWKSKLNASDNYRKTGGSGSSNARISLCSSKYALCPTVFNEYIVFGGTPTTTTDMELGVWIFDSPFTRIKMRDVPVVYHQQIQYSTMKYITMADLKAAILSARVYNLIMEFCGRGDWVFDDGSLPHIEPQQERPGYAKPITVDDLTQMEFTGTVNQIAKKFFMLQKASLATGKEGTSRLIFMEPYANIDASICDDKDYADLLGDLLIALYGNNPDSLLASSNGYYYHEDGFLPESVEVQSLRNQLFSLESSHYRTAMLTDIIQQQKAQTNRNQKMPFLAKCKRVVIGRSHIHGFGLFAVDTINKGDLILEYSGVVISDHMADIRETMYEQLLCGSIYMFRLDLHHIIDSTFYGNCARFINHSCDPNTATTNFSYIDEEGFGTHVGVYASKVIPAGEEIYYNYRLSSSSTNKEICHCGSYMCTGYMSLVK